MAKGGESLGNEEGSEEEEEVVPAENHTPRVRLLTLGVVFPQASRRITPIFRGYAQRTVRNGTLSDPLHA